MMHFKSRKIVHFILFAAVIVLQIAAFTFWYTEKNIEKNIYNSIDEISRPNEALTLSNNAIKSYFEADNAFNDYLNTSSKMRYENYQEAIKKLITELDKLGSLTERNSGFRTIIKSKIGIEKDISTLKSEFNAILKSNLKSTAPAALNFRVKSYDYEKVLSSISYDTTKTAVVTKKKGFFGRLGNAISGKNDVDKEEVKSVIRMVFNNQEKAGSFEEQLKNIFKVTENYYKNEVSKIQRVHNKLQEKDSKLIAINKYILAKSQEIVLVYSHSAQELNKLEYLKYIKGYNATLSEKQQFIFYLLLAMGAITALLLVYTIYLYALENKLQKLKNNAELNLDKKNQLIGMLSHEMRAPLNIISNFSKKLKNSNTDPALNAPIDSLFFTANSLQITVSQILDFFKNENNALILYHTKMNLKAEVNAILDSLKALAELKQLDIIASIPSGLDVQIWADKVKIHQLFYNIIGNAIKFTKQGSITVETNLEKIDGLYKLVVKIIDTGAGIPAEEVDKIFDQFYQSKTHQEQISFGAGLGLTLCKNIISLFNGEIKVKSKLNVGTEISFFLLLEPSNEEQETSQTKLLHQFKDKNLEVVVVDDDPMTLLLLKKLIGKLHFKATTFQDVAAAKIYLNTNEAHLIITDLQISEYSGFDFVEDIKRIPNKNATVPILVITGDSYMNTANLKELYVDDILIKPINKEELYFKMYTLLKGH